MSILFVFMLIVFCCMVATLTENRYVKYISITILFGLFFWLSSIFFIPIKIEKEIVTPIEWYDNSQMIYYDGDAINLNRELGRVIQPNEYIKVIVYEKNLNGIYIDFPEQYMVVK